MRILSLNTKLGELRARFGKRKKTVVTKTVMLDRYTNRRNERQNDDYRASTEPATKILKLKQNGFSIIYTFDINANIVMHHDLLTIRKTINQHCTRCACITCT